MKVSHTFIYFFFLALQDGNTGLINAEILVRAGTEGGNITVKCSFTFSGSRKLFCKEKCEEKDILAETTADRNQSGRYSIQYIKESLISSLLYVSITNLTKSDSGWYRCCLARTWFPDSYEEFEISVADASVPSASTLTAQSFSSSSGSSTSSSASPEATEPSQQQQTPAADPAQTTTGVLLYVGLILVAMIIVLPMTVLIFWRRRASKPKEPPVEAEYINVTAPNPVYEEIREDRQSRSPPVEISTVYSCAKYTKTHGVETTDDYSFVTAANSQNKTEDDSIKLTYSKVDFSNSPAASLNSAPCGDADNVIYSVPRVEASLDSSHTEDASAPLYSTLTLHQQ